jgi:hypothetical protein
MMDTPPHESLDRLTAYGQHSASTCRWATPTLFLQAPFWFEAENAPWTCVRDAAPRLLDTAEPCATCLRWERAPGVRGDSLMA